MSAVSPAALAAMAARIAALPDVNEAAGLVRSEAVRTAGRPQAAGRGTGPDGPAPAAAPPPAEAADDARPLAEAYGGDLIFAEGDPVTLQEALLSAALTASGQGITYLYGDDRESFQSYGQLLQEAGRLLGGLRAAGILPGDAVLFQLGDNRNFIVAFWACVLGGYLPTPVGIAPRYDEHNAVTRKLRGAWDLLGEPLILTEAPLLAGVRGLATQWAGDARVEAVEALAAGAEDTAWHPAGPDDPALHLLTSGSTGTPKCVRHSHRSIIARTKATSLTNGLGPDEVSLNWMPLDHVGGIVMYHVRDVILRCRHISAETNAFLADPLSWLDWIERFGVTDTWAPNFAYGLVNDQLSRAPGRAWDLSCVRRFLNGGEAVVPKTARRFLRLLAPHRLSAEAMRPSWGMSETSSGITHSMLSARDGTIRVHKQSLLASLRVVPDTDPDGVTFTEVGPPVPGVRLRIVDAADTVLPERHVGRLQVSGATLMTGYYRNDAANSEAFTSDGWFNTGDLAFLDGGRLAITGREKDVVIIRGANYLTYDIESVVELVDGTTTSFVAACGYTPSGAHAEELAVFFVPSSDSGPGQRATVRAIRHALSRELGLHADAVIAVRREQFPKTSSGKIQRAQLVSDLASGVFDEALAEARPGDEPGDWLFERTWQPAEPPPPRPQGGTWLLLSDDPDTERLLRDEASSSGAVLVTAHAGQVFGRPADRAFTVDPGDPRHYRSMLDLVTRELGPVTTVLHAWQAASPAATTPEGCVLSVLAVLKALTAPARLLVLTADGVWAQTGDRVVPARATLPGLVRTAVAERMLPLVRQVDLPSADRSEWAAAIRTELCCLDGSGVVAYRDGRRLVPRLRAVDPVRSGRSPLAIVPGGIYLVTGGLGGLGQLVSEYLLTEFGARLLLIGRSAAAGPSEQRLAYLATLGEVEYQMADVTDAALLRKALARAEERWAQPVAGVFHLAGTDISHQWRQLEEHTLDNAEAAAFAAVYGPKVSGTLALAEALADRPGASLILFSSVNAEFGGRSFGAYASASSFLNGFADHWARERGRSVQSISWSAWDGLGMNRNSPADAARARGFDAITEDAGLAFLHSALALGRPNVIAGLVPANPRILREMVPEQVEAAEIVMAYVAGAEIDDTVLRAAMGEPPPDCALPVRFALVDRLPADETGQVDDDQLLALAAPGRSDGTSRYVEPATDLERTLAAIWSDVLQLPRIGREDSFFEIGGDSLLAVRLVSRIAEALDTKVPVHRLYENPAIGLLAGVLAPEVTSLPTG